MRTFAIADVNRSGTGISTFKLLAVPVVSSNVENSVELFIVDSVCWLVLVVEFNRLKQFSACFSIRSALLL